MRNLPNPPGLPLTSPTVSKREFLDAMSDRANLRALDVSGGPNRIKEGALSPRENGWQREGFKLKF